MTSEEVAARFLSMNFPELFEDKEREKMTLGAPRSTGVKSEARTHSGSPRQDRKGQSQHHKKTPPWERNRYSAKRRQPQKWG